VAFSAKSLQGFVDNLGHMASQPAEGRKQLFAPGLENLVVMLQARDLPVELLFVSLECHLELLQPLNSL
jgi:hypothetical protein